MKFSRSHIGMIGIVSSFIGVIFPIFGIGEKIYPLSSTNLSLVSYIILIILSIVFYFVSTKIWRIVQIMGTVLCMFILYIAAYLLTHNIHIGDTSHQTDYLYWGVIFPIFGIGLLLYSGFSRGPDREKDYTFLSDNTIGLIGSMTLMGLSLVTVLISDSAQLNPRDTSSILQKNIGEQKVYYQEGVIMSEAYDSIGSLVFQRSKDAIYYVATTATGSVTYPDGYMHSGYNIEQIILGNEKIIHGTGGIWINGAPMYKQELLVGSGVIALKDENSIRFVTPSLNVTYTGVDIWNNQLTTSYAGTSIAWVQEMQSGKILMQDGVKISDPYNDISNISLSHDAKNIMAIGVDTTGQKYIIKNGIPLERLRKDSKNNTWISNGMHNIYVVDTLGSLSIIYDGVSIGGEYREVRDIFLEKNGNGYAFFARKKGEDTYCLITRFKGSVCGFRSYMNPGIGGDGSSIIYAGFKDGVWSVYKNSIPIVRDTGYTQTNIAYDYFFYDPTNPRQYIFIERQSDQKYMIRKNGKIIPLIWKDVGLNVGFGYDTTIILSAEDDQGWRIIEI